MRVAIIGAGPAGSALAIFLTRLGADVTLFDDGRRPELLVGESLVPAVVPIIQRLGLEAETAACGRVKPGVSFIWPGTTRFSFTFARFAPAVFPYAYNIARPQFDDAIVAAARGGRRQPGGDASAAAPGRRRRDGRGAGAGPRDAGRRPRARGPAARPHRRRDGPGPPRGPRPRHPGAGSGRGRTWRTSPTSRAASGTTRPGRCSSRAQAAGWSWCIPLKDRLSVGIVLGQDDAARLGRTPEERLQRAIADDAWLAGIVAGRQAREQRRAPTPTISSSRAAASVRAG